MMRDLAKGSSVIRPAALAQRIKGKGLEKLTENEANQIFNILSNNGKPFSNENKNKFKLLMVKSESEPSGAPRGGLRMIKPPLNNNEFANYIIKNYLGRTGAGTSVVPLMGRTSATGLKTLWEKSKERKKSFGEVRNMLKKKIREVGIKSGYHSNFNNNFNLVS